MSGKPDHPESTLPGVWLLSLRTPIGSLAVTLTIEEENGVLTGTAVATEESVSLREIERETVEGGERITWEQTITKPLRLVLHFDVVVSGDQMTGSARAGRLPRTGVTGVREGGV